MTPMLSPQTPDLCDVVQVKPLHPASFLVVADRPVMLFALGHLIQSQPGWHVPQETCDLAHAMRHIESQHPDCVLLCAASLDRDRVLFLNWLRDRTPRLPTILYTQQQTDPECRRCLRAGAHALATQDQPLETLVQTIRLALQGHTVIYGTIAATPSTESSNESGTCGLHRLSERELEVLRLIGTGHNNRRISQSLCRSLKTIESHRYRISKKLGVLNGPEFFEAAAQYASSLGKPAVAQAA